MKFLAMLGFSALALSAVAQIDPNRVVAIVNGEEIRGAEYYRRMEFLPGVGKRIGNSIAEATPGFLTIDALINEMLMLQLAKEKGVAPTDAEVQADLQRRQTADPTLLQNWLANGRTRPELEHLIRVELAQFKLETYGVTITDLEIEKFYKDNPTRFTTLRSVKLRVIAADSDALKARVDEALKSGKKFADVATEMSLDITRSNGGDFGRPALAILPEPVQKAIAAVKIGQVTEWVQTDTIWTKFLLEDVVPEKLIPLDAALKAQIRKQLMLDRGSVKNDLSKEMLAMRKRASVDIKEKQFAETYNKLLGSIGG